MSAAGRTARPGLGSYLAFSFSLLSILVTAVLLMVSEIVASNQVRTTIGTNLEELAGQTASRLGRAMFERYREVQLMAERISPAADRVRLRGELENVQRSYPNYAWIGLVDPAGRVASATGGLLEGVDVSARPWFADSRRNVNVGDVHEAVLLARLLPNAGDEPMRFVDIAFPVAWRGSVDRGVLAVHLSWTWARDIEKAIFSVVSRREIEPIVVSRTGVVLLGPPDLQGKPLDVPSLREAAAGHTGFTAEKWPDGEQYLVGYGHDRGYMSYPGLGWRVLVRQHLHAAYAPVRELQGRLLAWGLGVAAMFSLVGWLAARLITRPLMDLSAAARDLEAGGALRAVRDPPYLEVADLGAALASLVANLQQKEAALRELNASLERRVEERTAALRETFEHVRESEQRIQTILSSAPDPFVAIDFQGRITDWNPRAESLFGWKRDQVLGRTMTQVLVPERFRDSADRALAQLQSAGHLPFGARTIERVVVDRAGREIEVELRVGVVDTGKVQLLCAFMHDISHRKEVDRLKSEFVSTVSHELRTPLTSVYGSLRLLASGLGGALPAQAKQLLEMSTRSCERLIRLINDVLDTEKIASGRLALKLERQGLRALVDRAVRDTGALAQSLGVEVRVRAEGDADVLADADRIIQVVVNLLSNALKYSPGGAAVQVTLDTQGSQARVVVEDRGPGIPPEFRARIFERFAQADSSDRREKGGTGLGLNICRSIVLAHGGTIGFESEPGVRTAFHFELPLAPPA